MVDLAKIPSCELVEELGKREGVAKVVAEPFADVTVTANGPTVVLVVTD